MKLPTWLVTLSVSAVFTLQAWTLNEIVNLKVAVARLQPMSLTSTNSTP